MDITDALDPLEQQKQGIVPQSATPSPTSSTDMTPHTNIIITNNGTTNTTTTTTTSTTGTSTNITQMDTSTSMPTNINSVGVITETS
jgi:hypothetical protein